MVMKNLIAELLLKLAQKEEESKELVAQVEALEIIVTAMLRNMAQNEQEMLIRFKVHKAECLERGGTMRATGGYTT